MAVEVLWSLTCICSGKKTYGKPFENRKTYCFLFGSIGSEFKVVVPKCSTAHRYLAMRQQMIPTGSLWKSWWFILAESIWWEWQSGTRLSCSTHSTLAHEFCQRSLFYKKMWQSVSAHLEPEEELQQEMCRGHFSGRVSWPAWTQNNQLTAEGFLMGFGWIRKKHPHWINQLHMWWLTWTNKYDFLQTTQFQKELHMAFAGREPIIICLSYKTRQLVVNQLQTCNFSEQNDKEEGKQYKKKQFLWGLEASALPYSNMNWCCTKHRKEQWEVLQVPISMWGGIE